MKTTRILWLFIWLIPFTVTGQLTNIESISSFHEGLASIKKGTQWAFINTQGDIVIDFRDDLVASVQCNMECCRSNETETYPIFKNDRALIKVWEDGIARYGYIDTKGVTVIEPIFINATHFENNKAVVLKMYKEDMGKNELLDKNVVRYGYNEVIIDPNGAIIAHLSGPYNLLYDKEKLKTPPAIKSKLLHTNLVAVPSGDTWELRPLK